LDGLRGVAIALVIVGHLAHFSFGRNGAWAASASVGVSLFFALSGFLITNILLEEIKSSGRIGFRNFYVRRCLRLLPALFAFLVAMTVLKLAGLFSQDAWTSLAASVLYVRNIFGRGDGTGHLWSLSLEEQFYVTWPLLLFLTFRRGERITIVILVAVAIWRATAVHFRLVNEATGALYERPWFRYDAILYGCWIALVLRTRRESWQRAACWFHPLVTLPLLVVASAIPSSSPVGPFSLTLQALLAMAVTFSTIVSAPTSIIYRALASAPARFLGHISYSLYLWQQPFIVVRTPSWGGLRTFPLNLAAAFALALFSYYVIERPFLALKSRFSASPAATHRPLAHQERAAAPISAPPS